MSLDVHAMVKKDQMENTQCIVCASCVDICPKGVIRYELGKK
jgi:formate hydrogenlyase subunit 6/NADH:ubiquinone oxidoreductase subunit I